jgi:aspartyl/asparaginyl-tRNA synthetase
MKISDYTCSWMIFFINWTFQHIAIDDVQIDTEEGVYIIKNRNKKEDVKCSDDISKYHVAFIASLKWTIYVYDYAETSPNFYWRIYYKINEICQ